MTYLRQSTDYLAVIRRVRVTYNHNSQFIKIAASHIFVTMPSLSLLFIIALVEHLSLKCVGKRQRGRIQTYTKS